MGQPDQDHNNNNRKSNAVGGLISQNMSYSDQIS